MKNFSSVHTVVPTFERPSRNSTPARLRQSGPISTTPARLRQSGPISTTPARLREGRALSPGRANTRPVGLTLITLIASLLLTDPGRLLADGADPDDKGRLTLEAIYGSGEWEAKGYPARWASDSRGYYRIEKSATDVGGQDIVWYAAGDGRREVTVAATELCPPGSDRPLAIDDYSFSSDQSLLLIYTNSQRVWRRNTRGDYWLSDRAAGTLRKLGGDAPPASLMFAKFSPDGRYVAYVRDRDLYLESTADGQTRRLTQRESDSIINGTFDWVYEEELGLRDGFRWSPDSRRIAFWQLDTEGVPTFTMIRNTDGLYPRLIEFEYPKVGQRNAAGRIGVLSLDGGPTEVAWMPIPGDPREHYLARMRWHGDDQLLIQQLNRRQNTNRVFLVPADTAAGAPARELFRETDAAWVDVHDECFWVPSRSAYTWVSERDGWRQVYLAPVDGDRTAGLPADGSVLSRPTRRIPRQSSPPDAPPHSPPESELTRVTSDAWDAIELLRVDADAIDLIASPDDATRRYLYRASPDGGAARRLTPADQEGWHAYDISPDGRWAIHNWSTFDTPPVIELVELPDHRRVRLLEGNEGLREKIKASARPGCEFLRVDIGDGVELDGWCLTPPDFDPQAEGRYPLLIYVYGEPAGQTVTDRWGGRHSLWHRMMAEQGYVVMSFDNRGTPAPRGRAWRKCVYRQIGVLAPREQAAAVRQVLAERPYLDPQRVGVWGWSGGGSMSLNAIFKYPDLYRTAVSIAPVPNQRYYDTIYQERYMGLPGDNVDGFRDGSPIHFAHQLEGNLLLIHGTGDDNCHYQTMELLINRLIEHNKPFSMMAYPNRGHGISEGRNTTLHLRSLMTRYLLENL